LALHALLQQQAAPRFRLVERIHHCIHFLLNSGDEGALVGSPGFWRLQRLGEGLVDWRLRFSRRIGIDPQVSHA
jgi:hypothetical protein